MKDAVAGDRFAAWAAQAAIAAAPMLALWGGPVIVAPHPAPRPSRTRATTRRAARGGER